MKILNIACTAWVVFISLFAQAQDANVLLQKVKAKMDKVSDYEASGNMKTNVTFLKVPESVITIFYKKPDKLKIKSQKGLSFVPKGAVSINLSSILAGNSYSVIDAGTDKSMGTMLRVIKLLPKDDNADIVLSTLYIDEAGQVIKRAKTTTRENGSYELDMVYGRYTAYGLPDKITFTFNTRDYKLPKGITFDFDDGTEAKRPANGGQNKNGRAEIFFNSYIINKGIADASF